MAHIDYFFATISPFTYLSGTRPAEIAAKGLSLLLRCPPDMDRDGGLKLPGA